MCHHFPSNRCIEDLDKINIFLYIHRERERERERERKMTEESVLIPSIVNLCSASGKTDFALSGTLGWILCEWTLPRICQLETFRPQSCNSIRRALKVCPCRSY
ncbi:unnamed protein product [Lepidochelys olivacea]